LISLLGLISENATAVPPRKLEYKYPEEKPVWIWRSSDRIEQFVDDVSEKLDVTLAGRKYKSVKKNTTSAKISQSLIYREGGNLDPTTRFTVNLRLPNLERRWQLRFTSYDEEEQSRRRVAPHEALQPEREFGAGLGIFRELGKVKISFMPKLVLRDPLEMNYVLRFEKNDELSFVRILHRADLFANAAKGTGQFYEITLLKEFDRWSISTKHQEEYRERDHLFTVGHGLTFGYSLTDNMGVYQAYSVHSSNIPSYHLDIYSVSCGVGYEIRPQRFKVGLGPVLDFPKSRSFKGTSSLALTGELIF
jgi:hypothetical protein